MRGIGMSTRAIASATGDSPRTVRRAIDSGGAFAPPAPVTGTDGKTYTQRPQPQPEPEEPALRKPHARREDIPGSGHIPNWDFYPGHNDRAYCVTL